MSVSFLKREGAPDLAYRMEKGKNDALLPVIFLTGFRSDMRGTKAAFIADYCAQRGQTSIRFDYRGHGASGGAFEEGTIGLWLEDALAVLDHLCPGPCLLVGSSMGGWVGLLVAKARKDLVKGFIGLAAAPDFTRQIKAAMNDTQKMAMTRDGFFTLPSEYADEPYKITGALMEDGEQHCLLDGPMAIECPVRLMQGMKDTDVPWQTAHRIANALNGKDVAVYLRENGDHRLSAPEDLALLGQMIAELSQA